MSAHRLLRLWHIIVGGAMIFMMVAFLARWPLALGLWPWIGPYSLTGLSHIFLASVCAAIGVPVLWIGLSGEIGAGMAGTIDLGITFGGSARLLTGGVIALVSAAVMGGMYLLGRHNPIRDSRGVPRPVRAAFVIFTVALLVAGPLLLLGRPNIFPWSLSPEASVIYGWVFIGAAAYFVHGLLRPSWHNAAGQLLGFLAYDLVLIGPFLAHFQRVSDANRTSLIIYTSVLLFSGAIAVYYLLIHPTTRLWRSQPEFIPVKEQTTHS